MPLYIHTGSFAQADDMTAASGDHTGSADSSISEPCLSQRRRPRYRDQSLNHILFKGYQKTMQPIELATYKQLNSK